MLVEKEIIAPGSYWYTDEKTGMPRRLDVTAEHTHYWHEQGSKMLGSGLTVPVPYEHDFTAHPMTPKEKLLNNAGWIKEYRLKGDKLFGVVDVQDEQVAQKLPRTIRYTSPWINSFTDGQGRQWNNVITHLALTTRPRIVKQSPFGSVAAALSMAMLVQSKVGEPTVEEGGICLSRAGRIVRRKQDKKLVPRYPMAFSLFSGAAFGPEDGFPAKKAKKKEKVVEKEVDRSNGGEGGDDNDDSDVEEMDGSDVEESDEGDIDLPPLGDKAGDVSMEEVLCDLLSALGVHCEHSGDDQQFKRNLYMAAMAKVHELTAKGQGGPKPGEVGKHPPPTNTPAGGNPIVQQEQQPMYMSLEDIDKLPEPMKGVALAMHAENQKLRGELDAQSKVTGSLRAAKLEEASKQRAARVALLGKLSPRVKADLDSMLALPAMALSLGEGGVVNDPMASTLAVLEKGLADIPKLLTTPSSSLALQPQPADGDTLSDERVTELADSMARMMGATAARKAS